MCVTILKQCYGCGRPVYYTGFEPVPDEPMCDFCRKSSVKPRYVYINSTKEILPKFDYMTELTRRKSRELINQRLREVRDQ